LKALETRYHGYRFRSRLEARWAVFFDQAAVRYQYEPEGYLVEGKGYLPDFYLPQQDCFAEIKPKLPDAEELDKARLLALHTGKEVYILYGDVWHDTYQACRYTPARIYALAQAPLSKEVVRQEVAGFQEAKILLQKLDEIGLTVQVHEERMTLSSTFHVDRASLQAQHCLSVFRRQSHRFIELCERLQQEYTTVFDALAEQSGWKRVFEHQHLSWDFVWTQCSTCGDLLLRNEQKEDGEAACLHERCHGPQPGRYCYDSMQLMAAYQAARQERFST
jgi:hypothetical protein